MPDPVTGLTPAPPGGSPAFSFGPAPTRRGSMCWTCCRAGTPQDRLRQLRQHRADLHATCPEVRDTARLRWRRGSRERPSPLGVTSSSEGGFNLESDHPREAGAQDPWSEPKASCSGSKRGRPRPLGPAAGTGERRDVRRGPAEAGHPRHLPLNRRESSRPSPRRARAASIARPCPQTEVASSKPRCTLLRARLSVELTRRAFARWLEQLSREPPRPSSSGTRQRSHLGRRRAPGRTSRTQRALAFHEAPDVVGLLALPARSRRLAARQDCSEASDEGRTDARSEARGRG